MVRLSEAEALASAWRALAGSVGGEGWRTIPVTAGGPCRILAGRHVPGNEEAVLIGLGSIRVPPAEHLPEGYGFLVRTVDLGPASADRVWFALSRQPAGSLEMFTMMAADVTAVLNAPPVPDDERLLRLFLNRIRAWQSFMQRGREGVLSPEAELGLHGELVMLAALLESGLSGMAAVEAWCGPMDSLQDFRLGTGAIEVKTTLTGSGFYAAITSLEQLDDSLIRPLFLAGIRLRSDSVSGLNLPERVAAIRNSLHSDPAALNTFEARLLHAGFSSAMSVRYSRCFSHDRTGLFQVDEGFPRLIRSGVPPEIRKVRYEIDLDLVSAQNVELDTALQSLGVI